MCMEKNTIRNKMILTNKEKLIILFIAFIPLIATALIRLIFEIQIIITY